MCIPTFKAVFFRAGPVQAKIQGLEPETTSVETRIGGIPGERKAEKMLEETASKETVGVNKNNKTNQNKNRRGYKRGKAEKQIAFVHGKK